MWFNKLHRHHKWGLVAGLCSATVAVAVAVPTVTNKVNNNLPQAQNNCSLSHIYHPQRLVVHGCETVTGTVEVVRVEADGDYHVLLKLDPQYSSLINSVNTSKQRGDLVIEDVCQYTVTQSDAVSACQGYHSPNPIPVVGNRYEVRGNYVTDTQHGWNEVHGIVYIKEIQ